jgi:ABC-type phosphate transport system substrate-binding protein
MNRTKKAGLVTVAGAISLAMALPMGAANADVAGGSTDIVGVGSDTAQFSIDFLADGNVTGDLGFNASSASSRVVNFDASGDASGKLTAGVTSVLRAGTKPVTRPNGSGGGLTALLADVDTLPGNSQYKHVINYVRSSRLPTPAEQASAVSKGWGGLRVMQFATDNLVIAVNTASTFVPAGLSPAELVKIYDGTYTTWSQLPGYTGTHGAETIVPILPQSGSGTRNFFIADLKAANGGVDVVLAPSVIQTAQEHDPIAITGLSATQKPNALAPFSSGRIALLNTGYFGATLANTVVALSGTAPDAAAIYNQSRGLYVIIRQSDVANPAPFLAGGTKNWANTLFIGSLSTIAKSTATPLIQAAGVTKAYVDMNLAQS